MTVFLLQGKLSNPDYRLRREGELLSHDFVVVGIYVLVSYTTEST